MDDTQQTNRGKQRPESLDETQANTTDANTKNMPTMPPIQRHRQTPPPSQIGHRRAPPPRTLPPAKRGRARNRRKSGLYLPLWSLALMIIIVLMSVGGIILLFLNLGGGSTPKREPILLIDTAVPTQRPNSFPISPATPTIPPNIDPNQLDVIPTAPPIILSGPTLFVPTLSPTPRQIELGVIVIVADVGDQELNIRNQASVTDSTVIFRAPENTQFLIVDGPRQGDGLTWWQIQDLRDPSRVGWAASNYLLPEPENPTP